MESTQGLEDTLLEVDYNKGCLGRELVEDGKVVAIVGVFYDDG